MSTTAAPEKRATRRRASRAAGPANGGAAETTTVRLKEASEPKARRSARKAGPPPRRRPHGRLTAIGALVLSVVAAAAVAALVVVMTIQQRNIEAQQAREQRFVDTATQLAVNMHTFRQESVEQTVDQFYNSTSGPLRDMLSQNNAVETLKSFFRELGGSSEVVVNGAALEGIDEVSKNASVLVSLRITTADMDGNNQPSKPQRMRIIVHEDDNGHMTGYDLKWPNGGT